MTRLTLYRCIAYVLDFLRVRHNWHRKAGAIQSWRIRRARKALERAVEAQQ